LREALVQYIRAFSAETAGTFMGLENVTEKVLAEGDPYKITTNKINQNAVLV
jgi:hypothetical protein